MKFINDLPTGFDQPPGWALNAVLEEEFSGDGEARLSEVYDRAFAYSEEND